MAFVCSRRGFRVTTTLAQYLFHEVSRARNGHCDFRGKAQGSAANARMSRETWSVLKFQEGETCLPRNHSKKGSFESPL